MALIGKQIGVMNDFCGKLMRFVTDMGGFVHKDVHKMDIFSFFVWPIPCAFGDETIMELPKEALVNSCSVLNAHYTITTTKTQEKE